MRRGHRYRGRGTGSCAQGDSGEPQLTLSISVLVPGLTADFSGFAADSFARAPALSRCLSRARRRPFAARSGTQAMLEAFGAPVNGSGGPAAAFRYLGDYGHPPDAYCFNADPVHLRADTRGLLLFDAASLAITAAEAAELAQHLQPLLKTHGWTLHTPHATRWYLTGPIGDELLTTPLLQVLGKPVTAFLPRGRAAAEWLNRSNEWQMLLHDHKVNQQRAARGAPVINSLWLWGGGTLPPTIDKRFDRLYGTDSVLRGVARWNGSDFAACPGQAQDMLALQKGAGRVLLLLDNCQRAAAYEDLPAWNNALEELERNWFAPLLAALRRGQIKRLDLVPLDGHRYQLGPLDAWSAWRRPRDYRHILGAGEQA